MNQDQTIDEPSALRATKRRHIIVTSCLVMAAGIIVTILGRGLLVNPNNIPSALLGKPANPFVVDWLQGRDLFPGVNGSNLRLEDFRGKPVILNFWASWCVSCREEAAFFEQFWRQHQEDGIAVIGIAIQDSDEEALKFARFFGKTYILGIDRDGKAGIDYGVYGVPETFFIDRKGIIQHKEAGPVTAKMLNELVQKIL